MQSLPLQMQHVEITLVGKTITWNEARDKAYEFACQGDNDPMLMSWFDQTTGKFSPSCCKCDIKDGSAWEVYGRNHGGRLRISINNDLYVFIYT